MRPFTFMGRLPGSKSMLNRLLIIQNQFPALQIRGDSECDDVRLMKAGLNSLSLGQTMQAGAAGTVLRFLALRASRITGRHRIEGDARLFARPQEELIKILRQLGVQAALTATALEIEGAGWKLHGDTLLIPTERSSQFASAVLLSAWELPFDLYVSRGGSRASEGYWDMTVHIAQHLGMKIDFWDADFRVIKMQNLNKNEFDVEIDVSSAFALAAIAAVSGQATFLDFPESHLQPDARFTEILARMGVSVLDTKHGLRIEKPKHLTAVAANLSSSPDLFPALAALCALAEGESHLFGAPQLVHKESNRLEHLARLIRQVGREVEVRDDGLKIRGPLVAPSVRIHFDCDHDHRLAFAAAVLAHAGYPIAIHDAEVVSKSFPDFWKIVGRLD